MNSSPRLLDRLPRGVGAAILVAVLLGLLWSLPAQAADIQATPATYQKKVQHLVAGDTLHLAAGDYGHLVISGLHGTAASAIVITGPASGGKATFHANSCCNTVEILHSSYVVIRRLVVDGGNNSDSFGISAKGGTKNLVHHITIEGCDIINHAGGQQQDGISTKTPTWGWVIRGNRILHAGTGIYLGNSNGADPFVGGIIEDNLIENPIGYCMEVKWQRPRPAVAGMPTTPQSTIIRDNVFIKNDGPSPDGARPNLLVGGFPKTGPGASDRYEIYGNLLLHNPREALLQASGRVSIHDNVFVDGEYAALVLMNHDLPLKLAYVYDNTIYTKLKGIDFASAAAVDDAVVGNLVFAGTPITGSIKDKRGNLVYALGAAAGVVAAPSMTPGKMDFYPRPGQAQGAPLDLTKMAGDIDRNIDFNGSPRGKFRFRGAYAGEGTNPGWALSAGIKQASPHSGGSPSDGGIPSSDAGPTPDAAATPPSGLGADGGAQQGPSGSPASGGSNSGCGCRAARSSGSGPATFAFALLALVGLRRRRRTGRRE